MPSCKQVSLHKTSINQVEAWVPTNPSPEREGISVALAHATLNSTHLETLSSSLKRMVYGGTCKESRQVGEKCPQSEYYSFPRYEVLELDSEHYEIKPSRKGTPITYLLELFNL
ncbi:hypothetical protein K493DRAFT_314319 [Basidiobolus meristosporus CBS 931.73]|uniref:Uncharacterized protein n=1 Tax=Basidiobolus meristosporus CBS 931.73 TaxID=1314790 RepID=A0A1Y1YFQ7_9FUNG|nr:hypothetical protein K493DRAFT_314319 [Basidiobolus meristosporus CBS 931.73]|eukprot:ORX96815.1 hypothetical protein K493DRAFT_314319 [Basidiobolus meristosporus CBS 931.73]